MERKRLLVVTSTFPRWKGDHEPPFVLELCRRLKRQFEVHVLAPHVRGALEREHLDGIEITRFKYFFVRGETLAYEGGILARLRQNPLRYLLVPLFAIAQYVSLRRMLGRHDFDLVHAHWLLPQGLLAVLAKATVRTNARILCTSHGGDLFALRGAALTALKRFALRRCDCISVVSTAMRDEIARIGITPEHLEVIPMGVDLAKRFVPRVKHGRDKSVLFVGRLVEKKGLKYLIQAMSLVRHSHPDVILTVVGKGPEEAALREQSRSLGLESNVVFRGAMDNWQLPDFLQSAAIAVFPFVKAKDGDQEGFGLVLVEALGCECAVVTTQLPAIEDIITDGETGIIVDQKDEHAIAESIVRLLDNPQLRRELGETGRARVLARFDWDAIGERYSELLEGMAPQDRPPVAAELPR